jgi:hypothetical protein
MSASDYLENKLLDHSCGKAAYTMPAGVYLALYTDDPTDADSGTEVSGSGYAREAVSFGSASGGAISNSADIVFTATGSWGTVTHWGLRDASSAGNLLHYGAMTASKTIGNGDTLTFATGQLQITAD